MKMLARTPSLPAALAALDRAVGAGGTSALDPSVPAALWERALAGPAAEFLSRPGKQLRATLVRAGWALSGACSTVDVARIGTAIELLHAGSLVIDDVEDGSHERRGAPALHELVGVPLAINTGSWMYFWALAELGELRLPPPRQLELHQTALSTLVRCHQGQALDLSVRIPELEVEQVPPVVAATTSLKTGALCRLATELPAIAAGAEPATRQAIGRFGESIGVGLQMLDDLGSLASPARRAKGREDLVCGRPTWPWAWLAKHRPFAWSRLAADARPVMAGTADADALADALVAEIGDVGRGTIHDTLAVAREDLFGGLGGTAVTGGIVAGLEQMERSYG